MADPNLPPTDLLKIKAQIDDLRKQIRDLEQKTTTQLAALSARIKTIGG